MLENRQGNNGLFSLNTLIGLTAVTVATILLVMSCLFTVSLPCINNFYNQMPVYPGADLIEQKSSIWNYLGAGELELTYRTTDDTGTVTAWYQEMVDEARTEFYRAQVSGDPVPEIWDHIYRILAGNNGTEIQLEADCLN